MDIILQPWPWYVAGPLIALVMFLLFYFGKKFGVSSNLETICSIGGAGKIIDFFKFDWKQNSWNLMFMVGAVVGGFVAYQWMTPSEVVAINPKTAQELANLGFQNAGATFLPPELFSVDNIFTLKGFAILLISGILVGFGARYAGGCTSGHGIVGLSNLELPSLVSVIGFFIGGIVMTWFIIPMLF